MISASTRMAVLICAAPPLSANKPERISSRIDYSAGRELAGFDLCQTSVTWPSSVSLMGSQPP